MIVFFFLIQNQIQDSNWLALRQKKKKSPLDNEGTQENGTSRLHFGLSLVLLRQTALFAPQGSVAGVQLPESEQTQWL